jgi:putative membrane protein insertion efficiency factor
VIKTVMLLLIGAYRTIGTSFFGGSCRFEPSCSEYAVECVHQHSVGRAIGLIAKRIVRCRPGGSYGFDPVPSDLQKAPHLKVRARLR